MVQDGNIILLSRYFNRNVDIIAGLCARCYEECDEVQIVAVNIKFLLKILNMSSDLNVTESSEQLGDSSHVNVDKTVKSNDKTVYFKGFSNNDIRNTNIYVQNFIKTLELVSNEQSNASNISKYFDGFANDNINDSDNKKKSRGGLIRFKIYQRTDIKSSGYNKLDKSTKLKEIISYKPRVLTPGRRKYFSSVNNNSKPKSTIKKNLETELPESKITESKLKIELNKLESNLDIVNFKDEPPDFETEYFKLLRNNSPTEIKLEDKKFPIWIPPKSPHNLIEESLYHDPWALLVATIFLNRTKCMIARPYVFWFLKENPDPLSVLEKYPQELEKYFVNLGLQKTRAGQVWRMSNDYVYKKWKNVKELYGIGQYGETAFRMFCLGDFSMQPNDRFLRIYKAWYEKIGKKIENNCDKCV